MNKELNASYNILKNIYIDSAFSQIELNKALQNVTFNTALVTKIVYGVLDNNILLDYFLQQFYEKKPKPKVLLILKIGAYVSKFLSSIPSFALVNELVNVSKTIDKGVSGFVNSTLKNVIKTPITYPKEENYLEYLSVKYSYPKWLVSILIKEQGKEFTEEFLSYKLTTLTHIRVNLDETNATEFEKILNETSVSYEKSMLENAFYVDYQQLIKSAVPQNFYIVMGLTSMNLCEIINPKNNTKLLDACASPGGKSVYLAQLNKTVALTSADVYKHRVDLIKTYAQKYNIKNIDAIELDATKYNEQYKESFDYILCDVPCSGIGVVQKRPDIFLNKNQDTIKELTKLQLEILNNTSKYLKLNGELFYSTCTILKQENEDIILKFLNQNKNFKLLEINQPNNVKCIEKNKMLTYYPNVSNAEGFFISRLQKIGKQ